jgi:dimeric dUTPase (all-alpha-NTP-PPase superfamily)
MPKGEEIMSDNKSMSHVEEARQQMLQDWKVGDERHFTNMLDEMMSLQKQFGSKFCDFDKLTDNEKKVWTKEYILCLIDEVSELMNQIQFKHWKKSEDINETEVKYELIDMMHFLLSLMLVWKMDPIEVFSMYVAKNRENFNRQKGGY